MTKKYGVIVYNPFKISDSVKTLKADFKLTHCKSYESVIEQTSFHKDELLLIDFLPEDESHFSFLDRLQSENADEIEALSIVMLIDDIHLEQRLMACELGADDCISSQVSHDDLVTRLQSTIFNAIANIQLKKELKTASEVAMAAMANTGDLGCNIQFLLESQRCSNIDELGQLLFQSLSYYGIDCSLQMRAEFMVKNMEANGMEKAMESQLLEELKDAGRYYDFGCRTMVNYNSTSLLIKNMPMDDDVKYGMIKDNIFALLQGVDAKIESLNLELRLKQEYESQDRLILRMQEGIHHLGSQYRGMTKKIADVVDQMAGTVEHAMQTMLLTDEQEVILKNHMDDGRNSVCELFEQYASMDDDLREVVSQNSHIQAFKEIVDLKVTEDQGASNQVVTGLMRSG